MAYTGDVIVGAACCVAALTDLRTGKIPNGLVIVVAGLGLAWRATFGWGSEASALLGMLCVLAVLVPLFAVGWFGGGDVKFMAAIGAVLGFPGWIPFVLFTLASGGLLSIIIAARAGQLGAAMSAVQRMFQLAIYAQTPVAVAKTKIHVPYALAIASGYLLSLVWRHGVPL